MEKVTVGILTYNRKEAVIRAINSVLRQDWPNIEILVVDSHSIDGTVDIIRKLFPQITLISLPRNVGCPSGRNHIYSNATGDYIVNLDDDGELSEGVIAKIVKVFRSDLRIGIVAMRCCMPGVNRKIDQHPNEVIEASNFSGGLSAFRRTMLEKIGFYPEGLFLLGEETYLAILAINAEYRIVYCPNIIMWHPTESSSAKKWDFYRFRNSLLVVLQLFPGWLMYKYLLLRLVSYAIISLRRRTFHHYATAVLSVLWQLPKILLTRSPCKSNAVKKYLSLRAVHEDW